MRGFVDHLWRLPVSCRLSREHVPNPDELFRSEVECLRCGRVYDDGVAQAHRLERLATKGSQARRARRGAGRPFPTADHRLRTSRSRALID